MDPLVTALADQQTAAVAAVDRAWGANKALGYRPGAGSTPIESLIRARVEQLHSPSGRVPVREMWGAVRQTTPGIGVRWVATPAVEFWPFPGMADDDTVQAVVGQVVDCDVCADAERHGAPAAYRPTGPVTYRLLPVPAGAMVWVLVVCEQRCVRGLAGRGLRYASLRPPGGWDALLSS